MLVILFEIIIESHKMNQNMKIRYYHLSLKKRSIKIGLKLRTVRYVFIGHSEISVSGV